MLVLFETPAGYAVFKILNESKLKEVDNLFKHFETPEKASKLVQLQFFEKFKDATEALTATAAALECTMNKKLKKVVKKIMASEAHEELGVIDAKLGNVIKEKMGLNCFSNNAIVELHRNIKSQADNLIGGISQREYAAIQLGLAHGLSRYKLKFNPDKIDTMIIQAINLLDDLDKELNNYAMRLKEWYGWHFPELSKIVTDYIAYAKIVKLMGTRDNGADCDFSEILPEDVEKDVKAACDISMGTEISAEDVLNVSLLCDQLIDMHGYRTQLSEYLQNRMMTVAPNLTVLVGEVIGARLISHAGSLISLAKHPASTVQVFGAEKALFRAITKKQSTPKFGLLYNATLVNNSSGKYKGKISRMLAAKAAIAVRVDALREEVDGNLGVELRGKVESRIRFLESGMSYRLSGRAKEIGTTPKYTPSRNAPRTYDQGNDFTLESRAQKRKLDELKTPAGKKAIKDEEIKDEPEDEENMVEKSETPVVGKKKKKQQQQQQQEEEENEVVEMSEQPSPKKKKNTAAVENESEQPATQTPSKKKKKQKSGDQSFAAEEVEEVSTVTPAKGKKGKQSPEATTMETGGADEAAPSDTPSKKKKRKKSVAAQPTE